MKCSPDYLNAIALVTGGTRGIGLGIARALAHDGWTLALCGLRSREDVEDVAERARRRSAAEPSTGRPTSAAPNDRAQLLSSIVAHFGTLHALVNNAGRAPRVRADLLAATEDSFEEVLRTNLQGPYFLTQAVARLFVQSQPPDGAPRAIVFVTSVSAELASPHRGEYCVSKAGLSMAAKLFAVRLAPEGIPVYEVRPGIIATDMTAGVKDMYDKRIADGLVPEGRWGQPDDVGRAVASLLRGDIAYATGTVVQRRWWFVHSALMTVRLKADTTGRTIRNHDQTFTFDVVTEIERLGVVAIIRMPDPAALRAVVDALAEGGVRALEVTMTVPRAIELIAEIAPTLPADFLFGAGTVLDAETVHRAVGAGAQFIVSPVFKPEVIKAAHEDGVPVMPGCFTPTEILAAWEMGADIIKVFPATSVGPGYLKDIRGPLPHIKLMPTGGVSIDNAGDWLRAGAVGVGVGIGARRHQGDRGEAVQRHRRQRAPHRRERSPLREAGSTDA